MKELIKIEEKDGKQLVDARELWRGLESRRQFGNWIKEKVITNVFFEENADWTVINNSVKNPKGGRPTKDYVLTLDTAKKVAMAEQTEKGNEVRHYFLECEKKTKSALSIATPSSFAAALRLAADQAEKIEQQNQRLLEYEPKIEYVDSILQSTSTLTITQIAKDYGLSAKKLNVILSESHVQYKQSGQWLLYAKYADKGYTRSETWEYQPGKTRLNTKWTQKGRLFLHTLLAKEGIIPLMDEVEED